MNLPTRAECDQLFKDFHTPQGIINHSLAVNKVSNFIALKLKQAGEDVSLDLVDRASLLHDLLRICDIPENDFLIFKEYKNSNHVWKKQSEKYDYCHHATAAFEELKGKYPEMSQVILEHEFEFLNNYSFTCLEGKIVHYADKRVEFDKIVTLEKRLEEGLKRWKTPKAELEKTWKKLYKLEKELFNLIGENPSIIK